MSLFKPAGFFRRLFAFSYDFFIVFALLMFGTYALLPITHGQAIAAGNHWYQAYLVILLFAYWGGFWFWRQQTVGMLAWKIKLVSAEETKPKFWQVLIRFASAFVLSFVGLAFCLISPKKQALYDRIAKTKMIRY